MDWLKAHLKIDMFVLLIWKGYHPVENKKKNFQFQNSNFVFSFKSVMNEFSTDLYYLLCEVLWFYITFMKFLLFSSIVFKNFCLKIWTIMIIPSKYFIVKTKKFVFRQIIKALWYIYFLSFNRNRCCLKRRTR